MSYENCMEQDFSQTKCLDNGCFFKIFLIYMYADTVHTFLLLTANIVVYCVMSKK